MGVGAREESNTNNAYASYMREEKNFCFLAVARAHWEFSGLFRQKKYVLLCRQRTDSRIAPIHFQFRFNSAKESRTRKLRHFFCSKNIYSQRSNIRGYLSTIHERYKHSRWLERKWHNWCFCILTFAMCFLFSWNSCGVPQTKRNSGIVSSQLGQTGKWIRRKSVDRA